MKNSPFAAGFSLQIWSVWIQRLGTWGFGSVGVWRHPPVLESNTDRGHTTSSAAHLLPIQEDGRRRDGACKGTVVLHFVAFCFMTSDCCGAACSCEGNCFERTNNMYEGESKSKGRIHLTAVIEVTVRNFTYHFSRQSPCNTMHLSDTVIRLSSLIMASALSMWSCVRNVDGRPERPSSVTRVRPDLNLSTHS